MQCCDALVVAHPAAERVTAVWRDKNTDPPERISGVMLPPVVTTDGPAALEEASALAADGIRVIALEMTGVESSRMTPPHTRPFVRVLLSGPEPVGSAGAITLTATDPQAALDLCLVALRATEASLCPVTIRLVPGLDTAVFDTVESPDMSQLVAFLGRPSDEIDSPTDHQRQAFGARRRRIPSHVPDGLNDDTCWSEATGILEGILAEYAELTGREYESSGRLTGPLPSPPASAHRTRFVVVSTRAYSVARLLAETCASYAPARVTGQARAQSVDVLVGPDADMSSPADVVVAPGRPGGRLTKVLPFLREGGAVVVET